MFMLLRKFHIVLALAELRDVLRVEVRGVVLRGVLRVVLGARFLVYLSALGFAEQAARLCSSRVPCCSNHGGHGGRSLRSFAKLQTPAHPGTSVRRLTGRRLFSATLGHVAP